MKQREAAWGAARGTAAEAKLKAALDKARARAAEIKSECDRNTRLGNNHFDKEEYDEVGKACRWLPFLITSH